MGPPSRTIQSNVMFPLGDDTIEAREKMTQPVCAHYLYSRRVPNIKVCLHTVYEDG